MEVFDQMTTLSSAWRFAIHARLVFSLLSNAIVRYRLAAFLAWPLVHV